MNYSKFERFSKVADEISAKILSSFLEYEVLLVVTDRYDFKFSIKAAYTKHQTKDLAHIQEILLILLITKTSTVISKLPREFEQ